MRVRVASCRLRDASYESRVTSRELRVARCELRLPSVEGLGNSMAYICTFVTPLS